MRNLKRVLSLALACVMVIGMMVMTTGAADIVDIDEVKNTEAVTVMNALEVLEGDENGNFNPTAILTREQAAKIICYMLMGAEKAEKLVGTSNYTDVAADRWSAPYIAYCSSLDIISGYAGQFDPTGELTGVAFAKMLLVALGYDAAVEGYVNNDNWATNIGKDAVEAGLDIRNVDLSAALSRDNAAQMALQALEADMVEYEDKGTSVTIGGVEIVTGASKAEAIKADPDDSYKGDAKDDTLQFCEKYFEDLEKDTGKDWDAFGRPLSHSWTLDNEPVITVGKKAAAVYTESVAPATIAKDLSGYTFDGYKVNNTYEVKADTAAISGLKIKTGDTVVEGLKSALANGTLVEFYANKDKEIEEIVTVTYSTGYITDVKTDKDGNVNYTVSATKVGGTTYTDYADEELTDTVKLYGSVRKMSVVTYVEDDNKVMHIYPTTSFEGTQSANKADPKGNLTLTIDGETYKVSASADATDFTVNDKGIAHTYYVDQYGFIVSKADIDDVASTDYAYIVKVDEKESMSFGDYTTTVKVKAMLADGTVSVYTVALESDKDGNCFLNDTETTKVYDITKKGTAGALKANALEGGVYGYTFDEDGQIVLEELNAASGTMQKTKVYTEALTDADITGTKTGSYTLLDDETIYVVYNAKTEKATVYTADEISNAYKEVDNGDSVITATSKTYGTATVVFAETATEADATNVAVVFVDDAYTLRYDTKTKKDVYVYTGVTTDGEEIEQVAASELTETGLFKLMSDNKIKNENRIDPATPSDAYVYNTAITVEADMLNVDGTFYTYDNADVVDLTREKTGIDEEGFCAYIVLKKVGEKVTSDIEALFIVDAPKG